MSKVPIEDALELGKKAKEEREFKQELKDDKMRDAVIEKILSSEKPEFQSLGKGIHNNLLYFGTKINLNDKFYDAVVTSEPKIYVNWRHSNEIKSDFGLNYRFPLFDDVLDRMWSRTGKYGILNFLKGNVEHVTIKELYENILKLNEWKVYHLKKIEHKKHALDIIASYFDPLFECHGRVIIYGESGWGKTRQTKIYQLLAFNPSMSLDFSDSSIFRIIESTKSTTLVDNFDMADDDKRKRILNLVQGGYASEQKAVRSEKGGTGFRPTGFNIYAHMVINALTSLGYVSENRGNITRMLKSDDSKYAKLKKNNPIWQETMDKAHVCAMQNYQEIQKIYNEMVESKLVDRELERAMAILTIAKAVSNDLYNEMLEYFVEENKRLEKRDFKTEWAYNATEYIIARLSNAINEGDKEVAVSSKMIGDGVGSELFNPEGKNFERNVNSFKRNIGKIFANCPLFSSKTIDGYQHYIFNRENLTKFCKMKGYADLLNSLNPTLGDYTK